MKAVLRCATAAALVFAVVAATSHAAESAPKKFRLMTLDPGHFHASLVQKFMYADVDPLVHVYAPPGDDVAEHLKRVERFNTRANSPTHWLTETYTGSDYFDKMLADKPGNVVVISGNNARKTDYILRSVQAGLNVLGDKPMVRTPADLERLQQAFTVAKQKNVLLYDIMTERYEITTVLQHLLSRRQALFGQLKGSAQEPAIVEESVHYFSKTVAGAPLIRPQWFFDARQQGEGIVDVTTHLVDLVQWHAFPEQTIAPAQANVEVAKRWSTPLTLAQFKQVTGANSFPSYLAGDVRDGKLHVYANGEFTYALKGVYARVAARWDFESPPGSGDTHHSILRGTRATLAIRQGAPEKFKPVLYVEKAPGMDANTHEAALRAAIAELQKAYPGVDIRRVGGGWAVTVPEKYDVGHEAHFATVTENFLRYLRDGGMPEWEAPNTMTKYATIMKAYELSHRRE